MTEDKSINSERINENLDYDCLQKYNEKNSQFSMEILFEKNDDDEERFVGYDCLYRYDQYRIQLEYHILTGLWKTNSQQIFDFNEQQMFYHLFEDLYQIRCLTLDEQIQLIIQRLNQYFDEKMPHKNIYHYENKISINSSSFKEENSMKTLNNALIESSLYPGKELAIPEDDDEILMDSNPNVKEIVDYGLQSLVNGSRPKFYGLGHPPPVAPRRSRQNSACSTQSSIRYASFLPPPPSAPVRRRRVVESILLHVQRKKKPFEKLVDAFKQPEAVTMYDLGMQFLRLYDGKFNYREGHTFIVLFRKKTWYLTIDEIKCVECQVGEKEPRSALLLEYKNRLTRVQV